MLLSVLGLLLAGAEPSSYGVLNYGTGSPLDGDTSQGYATNVVVHPRANDSTNKTMHIHKVPLACMEHPAAHKPNTPELTSPPHIAQRDLVLPRGPVNWDAHLSTTGIGYVAKATCPSNSNHSKHEPRNLWWALQQVAEEYQYFVRKRPSSPKSRRRRRYEERISCLAIQPGRPYRLVCLAGAGHLRSPGPARSRRTQVTPSLPAGREALPRGSIE